MIDKNGNFYLGKIYDPDTDKIIDDPLLYEPSDLTTHAVVVGMTGSGKTGLCIDLLEEAAISKLPAILIDPKGDITNTLLHFPELLPEDFEPWMNASEAKRSGITIQAAAEETATKWKKGLKKWGIEGDDIRQLKDSVHYRIFTPGSSAGYPVNILTNLKAPDIPWQRNKDILRDKISGTVSAILGLVGLENINPVQSREHILLSNLFEHAWSKGRDLNLSELIIQTQNPPFQKLGIMDIDTFFPVKERFELAMLINNILAAPSFQSWIEGHPLDISSILVADDGKPCHSVFYIAHLSDAERMFFVTLLYSAIETWMRALKGSTSLRAIIYFDEIFGYLPPIKNPPSKKSMLRILKQGRAFGVGQVLVTQNPVDLDYKALSNAGTWFIGKLQTERDKNRLLDGLEGASPGLDRQAYEKLISSLDKRVFLLHNVHEQKAVVFHTRWAMNYLAGPLTRVQIHDLNLLAGATANPVSKPDAHGIDRPGRQIAHGIDERVTRDAAVMSIPGSSSRGAVPQSVDEYFLPNNLTFSQALKSYSTPLPANLSQVGLMYKPHLLVQAEILFLQRKYNLDHESVQTALVKEVDRRGSVRWEDWTSDSINSRKLDKQGLTDATFDALDAPLNDGKTLRAMKTDFADWIYHSIEVIVLSNQKLKIYGGPDITPEEFDDLCKKAAQKQMKIAIDKVETTYKRKMKTVADRLRREERELDEDEDELRVRKLEETGTHLENIASVFGFGRKRSLSTSLSKRRMTSSAKADVKESVESIEEYKKQLSTLAEEQAEAEEDIRLKWDEIADDVEELPFHPYKKNISIDLFGVAWFPYFIADSNGSIIELPAYETE